MTSAADIPIGERLRFYRKAQGKSQEVIAGLAQITEDYLSQIERGLKTPSIATMHQLARALGVSVSVLLGEPAVATGTLVHPVASKIQAAMMAYGSTAADQSPAALPALRGRVEQAWSAWQGAPRRYTKVGAVLPQLVTDVQAAVRVARSEAAQAREVARLEADLYFLLRTFAKRIGRPDLSLLAADRAVLAAERADDPVRISAAHWNMAHILIAQGEPEGALDVAVRATEQLATERSVAGPNTTAMVGALWLVAAVAAVRLGQEWQARELISDRARPAAAISGERNVAWTVFGPTNVELHALSIEMETGHASEALSFADAIDVSRSPSLERRTTFYLEVARCYEQRRDDAGVLLHLMSAESTGPEDLRYNLLAQDLVRGLLKRARPTLAPQVKAMAARVGALAS